MKARQGLAKGAVTIVLASTIVVGGQTAVFAQDDGFRPFQRLAALFDRLTPGGR